MKDENIEYYNENSEKYIEQTINIDMGHLYSQFLSYIPQNGLILDIGAGSGRDSRYFKEKGYDVYAHDASISMVQYASVALGDRIKVCKFSEFNSIWLFGKHILFDGMWACSCLLHVPYDEMRMIIINYSKYLKKSSVFLISFKYGDCVVLENGRTYYNMNENMIEDLICSCNVFDTIWIKIYDSFVSDSVKWTVALLKYNSDSEDV